MEDRPVSDRITPILHRLGLTERRCDRAGIEMVSTDREGCAHLTARYEIVERDPEPRPLALAEPADPGREPLEGNPLLRHRDPAPEVLILGEEFEDEFIGPVDILRITREGDPPEGALTLRKEGSDIGRNEAGEGEGILEAGIEGLATEVVAIVEGDRSPPPHLDHGLTVDPHRLLRATDIILRIPLPQLRRRLEGQP